MPYATALNCAIQVVRALEAAHGAGILHRDLKPQNVMLDASGNVKVVDFGLAKLNERPVPGQSQALETHTGVVMGTAAYMSPEQLEGKSAGARSDLFSFGVLLYQMLGGRRAFSGGSPAATLAAVLQDHPKPLDSAAWQVVSRCLEKNPAKRFQTARELHAALQAVRESTNRISRKSMRYAAATLAVVTSELFRNGIWLPD